MNKGAIWRNVPPPRPPPLRLSFICGSFVAENNREEKKGYSLLHHCSRNWEIDRDGGNGKLVSYIWLKGRQRNKLTTVE